MTIYAKIDADGYIEQFDGLPDAPDTEAAPPPDDSGQWVAVAALPGPRPSAVAQPFLLDGAAIWRDPRTLGEIREAKIAEMSAECVASILSGFRSSALGAEHTYPAKPTDQTNLAGSILDSLIAAPGDWATPFWCADAGGTWDFRMHTAAQIQQVGRDGKAAILAAMTKNEGLRAQIMASTIAEIDLIHW